MRRTLLTAACLFASSAALAAPCPSTEREASAFVATLAPGKVVSDGGGQNAEYLPGDTEVLGVRPFFVQLQGIPAFNSVSRLRFDYRGTTASTRAAFEAAFPGASCDASGACQWRNADAGEGELEEVRTQDLYNEHIALLCDYK